MAFAVPTVWDVRTTGNDANGGGFNPILGGTDYSQQDSPQWAYTDLVLATTTTATSVARPFQSTDVGNVINITSGTGWTVQRVQITAVNATTHVATFDKAAGTAASVGGTGNFGGGFLTIPASTAVFVAGNAVYLKAGTYTITTALAMPASLTMVGYNTIHTDLSATPLVTTATLTVPLWVAANFTCVVFHNIAFSSTASVRHDFWNGSFTGFFVFRRCSFDGFSNVFFATNASSSAVQAIDCSFTNMTASALNGQFSTCNISNCYFYNCTTSAITNNIAVATSSSHIDRCIIDKCGTGIFLSSGVRQASFITNCTITGSTADGIELPQAYWQPSLFTGGSIVIENNIIYGNGRYGVNAQTADFPANLFINNNAIGANTTANYLNCSGTGDIALTATPFTNSASQDFSLNATAGGGASCKGTGYPGLFPGGTTTGHLDVGAVQSTGGGTIQNYGYTG